MQNAVHRLVGGRELIGAAGTTRLTTDEFVEAICARYSRNARPGKQ